MDALLRWIGLRKTFSNNFFLPGWNALAESWNKVSITAHCTLWSNKSIIYKGHVSHRNWSFTKYNIQVAFCRTNSIFCQLGQKIEIYFPLIPLLCTCLEPIQSMLCANQNNPLYSAMKPTFYKLAMQFFHKYFAIFWLDWQ